MELFLNQVESMTENLLYMRNAQYSDIALMAALSQGRHDALTVVVDRYLPLVYRTVYMILCDRIDSDEVTIDVFLKIRRNASDFDDRHSLDIWVYRMICWSCEACLRKRRLSGLWADGSSVYESSSPRWTESDNDFIEKEMWEMFCRASRNLSARQRIIFTLIEFEKLEMKDVAIITGLSPYKVAADLYIARNKFVSEHEYHWKVSVAAEHEHMEYLRSLILTDTIERTEIQTAYDISKGLVISVFILLVFSLIVALYGYVNSSVDVDDKNELWSKSRVYNDERFMVYKLYDAYEHGRLK